MKIEDIYRWYLIPNTLDVVLCDTARKYLAEKVYGIKLREVCGHYVERVDGIPNVGFAKGRVKPVFADMFMNKEATP